MTEAKKELQAAIRFYEETAKKFGLWHKVTRAARKRVIAAGAVVYGIER